MLNDRYDLIVVGGGITGAGIFREAVKTGAKVLLVEQNDFASGTSSWSSKLVHGGLRYLKTGEWKLTLESVRERQRLLNEAPGLVERQAFLMPIYRGRKPGKTTMRIGLWLYDRMAGVATSHWLTTRELQKLEPHLRQDGLLGALAFDDARTDDVRLVLRLIFEAVGEGGTALNFSAAQPWRENGRVHGIVLADGRRVAASMVVNATGVCAGDWGGASPTLRPLRGSHFIFPLDKLPIVRAVSWLHPRDRRPVFVYPWLGAALYGTTDLDHDGDSSAPRMNRAEADYLLEGLAHQFPDLRLTARDAISTYAGVRPVVASGKNDPSAESRESALWSEPGLVGITGGKLTTFRITARQVLREAAKQNPALAPSADETVFRTPPRVLEPWAQLRHSARHEHVRHLGDLMMRRTRFGLLLPKGGADVLERVGDICKTELKWDDARWQQERTRYQDYWQRQHNPDNVL